jgi:hypothetical protein
MALSNETKGKLADALVPEVVRFIDASEQFTEFLQNQLIPDAITDALGEVDEDLKFELSLMIFDSIWFSWNRKND